MFTNNMLNKFQSKFINNPKHLAMSGHISQSITITPITTTVVATTTPPQTSVSIIPVATVMTPIIQSAPKQTVEVIPSTSVATSANRMPQTKFETTESPSKMQNVSLTKTTSTTTVTPTPTPSPRTPITTNVEGRRSSSRSIKRKRFDDEIVEYSINYPTAREQHRGSGRPRSISHSFAPSTTSISSGLSSPSLSSTSPVVSLSSTSSPLSNKMSPPKSIALTPSLNNNLKIMPLSPVKNLPTPITTTTATTIATTAPTLAVTTATATTPITTTAAISPSATVVNALPLPTTEDLPTILTTATTVSSLNSPIASVSSAATQPDVASSPLPSLQSQSCITTPLNSSSNNNTTAVVRPSTVPRQNLSMRSMSKLTMSAERRRNPRTGRRRKVGTGRPSNQAAVRDLGRWKPVDDLTLITGVQQTQDLRVIHRACKFSCRFTLSEIQARWYSLLYEPAISRTAAAAMRNLHPEMIESIQRKALFSNREEEVLSYIKSTDNPELSVFEELLRKHAGDFHSQRTAKSLQNHWQLMRQYQLLCDQMPKPLSQTNQPISFSDAEDQMMDPELNDNRDETLDIELALSDRSQKRHIRILESELNRWNVLIDSMTGTNSLPEFDSQTLAVLRGRMVRYLMRSKEITFGRDAKDQNIDVDLSLEGPAAKISRKQGTIKLRSNGDFFIANEGKRPIYINGLPLATGNKTRLANNFVVEVCGLRLVFLTNYELINAIRHESAKTTSPLN